ncbi:MAG: hypothetical protein J0L84_20150 [Verrucomicrobia bacterium]|nr:hypothetical protein [Verrucomicrobiota bacterium]
MIAAEKLQNRAVGHPAPFGRPTTAEQVFLNLHQTVAILRVPYQRAREALISRRLVPNSVDGRGNAMFRADRLHELAVLLGSPKAGTTFEFNFGPSWDQTTIVIAPPPTAPR